MALTVSIGVDVEHDCPPFLTTYHGMEVGMPRLLRLFDDEHIVATFFTTGDCARRYPDIMRAVVDAGHELGCHGDTHQNFAKLSFAAAKQEIDASTATLRRFAPMRSFRAPYLQFPHRYVPLLVASGYTVDSSQARYKPAWWIERGRSDPSIARIPASLTSSALRLPATMREFVLRRLTSPAVLFVHPWEFVDWTKSNLRWDCRFKTGIPALHGLRDAINFYQGRGAAFARLGNLAAQRGVNPSIAA